MTLPAELGERTAYGQQKGQGCVGSSASLHRNLVVLIVLSFSQSCKLNPASPDNQQCKVSSNNSLPLSLQPLKTTITTTRKKYLPTGPPSYISIYSFVYLHRPTYSFSAFFRPSDGVPIYHFAAVSFCSVISNRSNTDYTDTKYRILIINAILH